MRTRGSLTRADRRALVPALVRAQVANAAGHVRLATGRRPSSIPGLAADPAPPDTPLARQAEDGCLQQSAVLVGHSYRTWLYGTMLAHVDGEDLDAELFYVAALLHDTGLVPPTTGQDFTLRSASVAAACMGAAGSSPAAIAAVQDAITVHTLPGVSARTDGGLGCYLQAGAMLDLAGTRAWDVPGRAISAARTAHRTDGLVGELSAAVRAESAAVPDGRFALISRWGFLVAVRLAHRGS